MIKDFDIPRDDYIELIKWKDSIIDTVLLVEGARQVGKTYLVKKFAKENFKNVIYINMLDESGIKFLDALTATKTNSSDNELISNSLKTVNSSFVDNEDCVVIIDEIQESSLVYNKIRNFNRYMKAKFIVTGSYLGRVINDAKFWESVGDTYDITIRPLTFKEFLRVFNKDAFTMFNSIGLYEDTNRNSHLYLSNLFKLYLVIGGYPAIVKTFIGTQNINNVFAMHKKMLSKFSIESARYLGGDEYSIPIEKSFEYFAIALTKEKKGLKNHNPSRRLSNIDISGKLNFSEKQYTKLFSWLVKSNILYSCSKAIDCDLSNTIDSQRFYFNDVGLLNSLLSNKGIPSSIIKGSLYENYVCNVLEGKGLDLNFATFNNYELDFLLAHNKTSYGIEVKSGKMAGESVKQALRIKRIDKILYLKGDTFGGKTGDTITLPIYLFERFSFEENTFKPSILEGLNILDFFKK